MKDMNSKNIIIVILIVLIVGGGMFFAGTKYQQGKRGNIARQFDGQRMMGTGNGNQNGFRPVNGDIVSVDDKSITVKLVDGSSKIVLISDKTEINKAEIATSTDLKVGEKVAVFGTSNADGSVTAQNIQLNPIARVIQSPAP
jgi:hypothetical protein